MQASWITHDGVRAPASYFEALKAPVSFSRIEIYDFYPTPLDRPFCDATMGPFNYSMLTHWIVLYDENGITGQGPCTPSMAEVILPLVPLGVAKDSETWWRDIYWAVRNRGFATEAAVELGRFDFALHDILAKRAGLPLHRFLGADRDWVKVYASGFGTNLSDAETAEEAETFLRDGYSCFKMKAATDFGTRLDRDVKRVAFIRGLLGEDKELAVDVNQLWNAEDALAFIQRLMPYRPAWYEEPVRSYDVRELEKLVAKCPVPIAMGESMRNRYQFYPYIKAGVQHLQPIPSNVSGVRDWLFARDEAVEFGLTLSAGGFSHLTAPFIATAREEDMVEYLYPIVHKMYEYMELRPEEKDGCFFLPAVPGIPMAPDLHTLDRMGLIAQKRVFVQGK